MTTVKGYIKTGRTGGTASDLDGIDGNLLINDIDWAFVIESDGIRLFVNDPTGGAAEDDPYVVVPDANPGANNWELKAVIGTGENTPDTATISGGIVTLTHPGWWKIATEGGDAEDNLDKIEGLAEGDKVLLSAADGTKTVIVKNGSFLKIGGDFYLNSEYDMISLKCFGSDVCAASSTPANNGV